MIEASFGGSAPLVTEMLAGPGFGWHIETAVHVLRMVLGGVFDRFPKLQFATIEAGAGWVPYTLHAMDFGNMAHNFWVMPKLKYKPSEYYAMHGHSSFETDPIGVELRHRMGVNTLLWGNDYPHIEGCWPNSQEQLGIWGKDLTHDEKAQIIGLNSAKLFNIDVPERFRVALCG